MASIEQLIDEISDISLRQSLLREVRRLKKDKQFGLVFEQHLPEVVPIFSAPIRPRATVALKGGNIGEVYRVLKVVDGQAHLIKESEGRQIVVSVDNLVVVRCFGEPIYPALIPIASVQNGGDSPFHTLIEADNYHALQLLDYLYAGQVDCIYIDPPYNTGARDWKYNNNYVDKNDTWRHSKWLSFMARRITLAKRLLNPNSGVLIITIDEHEVHYLGTLLKQIFPEAYQQMITIVINPKGNAQGRFARVEEYAIYCFMPNASIKGVHDDLLTQGEPEKKVRWKGLLRSGTDAQREDREGMFYPILIDPKQGFAVDVGDPLPINKSPKLGAKINGKNVAWPIRDDGSLGRWSVGPVTLKDLINKGYISVGKYDEKRKTYGISYLSQEVQKQITEGKIIITGFDEERNCVTVEYADARTRAIKTVWHRTLHDAGAYGSDLLKNILGRPGQFSFPKSLYSVLDAISPVIRDKKDAIIIDFFAGSGTTLHAVNLLNASDNGKRRCILVTNNEVPSDISQELASNGLRPGQEEWEIQGICRNVTWPRIKNSTLGRRDDGSEIEGEYYTGKLTSIEKSRLFHHISFADGAKLSVTERKQIAALIDGLPQSKITKAPYIIEEDIEVSILFDESFKADYLEALEGKEHITRFIIVTSTTKVFNNIKKAIQDLLGPFIIEEKEKLPFAAGFAANLEYFKLDFLDPNEVALGRQFDTILPILWMMAGAKGPRPKVNQTEPWIIADGCPLAVLFEEVRFLEFRQLVSERLDISHVFIVTDSEEAYLDMKAELPPGLDVIQLYKNYLKNFEINIQRMEEE